MSRYARVSRPLMFALGLSMGLVGCGSSRGEAPTKALEEGVDLLSRFAECRNWQERREIDVGGFWSRGNLGEGFAQDEREPSGRTFVWATREVVDIHFMAAEVRPTRMVVRLRPFHPPGRERQTMTITLNGERVDEMTLAPGFHDYGIGLPEYVMRRGRNTLRFAFAYAAPATEGQPGGTDRRRLAAAFDRLTLESFVNAHRPRLRRHALEIPAGAAAVFEVPESEATLLALVGVEVAAGHLTIEGSSADAAMELFGQLRGASERVAVPLPPLEAGVRRVRLIASPAGPVTIQSLRAASPASQYKRAPPREAPSGPHVIVYLVDTLRRDRVGAFGGARRLTPSVDAFAETAFRFDDAHAQAPWTKPAVASLFTGLNARRHGVNRFGSILPESAETLPEAMRAAGYATVAVSGSAPIRELAGFSQGFEIFEEVDEAGEGPSWPASPLILDRLDALLAARDDERPLFLYVHTTDPHSPYAPPRAYRRRFARDASRGAYLASELRPELRDEQLSLYEAEVAFADDGFRRFLETLRRHDLHDEAFILFVADHGEQFYEHQGWRHSTNHAEVIRIPMILRTPRSLGFEPRVIGSPTRQIDIFPTLASILGLTLPAEVDGRDLAPLLRGEREAPEDAPASLSHIWRTDRQDHSIVAHPWKLMLRLLPDGSTGRRLYRVSDDPEERVDVSAQHPEVVARLEALLREGSVDVESALPTSERGRDPAIGDELDAQLRALGYAD